MSGWNVELEMDRNPRANGLHPCECQDTAQSVTVSAVEEDEEDEDYLTDQ
jgi:hypothetical protein